MISIDDLRIVAALASSGSVKAAAAALRIHGATLYRHLRALEASLGGPLFERYDGQLVPTARAEPLLAAEADVRDRLAEVERNIAAQDDRLTGPLHVTTADTLLPIVCRCLRAFALAQPGIAITVSAERAFADLARREADVAIRPTRSPPENLVGTKVAAFAFRPYARADTAGGGWIGFDAAMAAVPVAAWIRRHVPASDMAVTVGSVTAAADAAEADWGRAVLPDYLGRARALVAAGEPVAALASELWLLYHPDLRRNARVRALTEFAAPWLRREMG